MARLRAQLAELETAEQKQPAMVAHKEEEPDEPEFMLMAQPARERDELGLRRTARRQIFPEDMRREDGPRRRASDNSDMPGAAYRHPQERMTCQATVLTIAAGAITIGGFTTQRAIVDTGAAHVLIGRRLADKLQLSKPGRLIAEGYLLMTADGGEGKWMPKTRQSMALMLNPGTTEECALRVYCGVSELEDFDLLIGVEYLFGIGATICMWEEKVLYRVCYWEDDGPIGTLPVRFVRREPREAYQSSEAEVREELGIPSWQQITRAPAGPQVGNDGEVDLKALCNNTKRLMGPTVVLDLFGGIGTGLAAVLKAGVSVEKWILVESDMEAAKMAVCHAQKLHERYPHQFCTATLDQSLLCGAASIQSVDEQQLRRWGRIDVVVAGWECQGYSRAGAGRGMRDERSSLFRELKRVLELIKRIQGEVIYIVENVDMEGDIREQVQVAHKEVTAALGPGVVADGAQAGSRIHRVRRYWTNGVSEAALQYRLSLMERPVPLLVEDILEPGRMPAPVERPDHPTQFPCNEVGKPRQASHNEAAAFRIHEGVPGPGMVYDSTAREWQPPTAVERELAMGFMIDATAHPEVTEEERRKALGRAMDLNVMHWLVATIRMYHSQLRWERKQDKAAAVQPPTERSRAKEALARAMLGEIQEQDDRQHERGHPLERRWVYRWEEEDERPVVYAEQEDIWLSGDREEEAVDKKREDFSWLEGAIERQRSRESYEREFGPSDFALMAAAKEEGPGREAAAEEHGGGDTEADQRGERRAEERGQPEKELGAPSQEGVAPEWVIGEGVSEADADKLKGLLAKHRAAFAYSLKEVGRCNMAEVTLELTTDIPVYQQRRRMTMEETQICKEKCQELLEAGFIRKSNSEYAAATVVAARTDLTGKVLSKRMCGDYRGLNKVTIMKRYQTPMPDEIFDLLAEALVFSTLDLRQGFNQIPIAEADKKKTAFHGPDGQYEWNFLPFGLKSASPEFQRVMDQVLREVQNAACYIDDVIVFSTDSSSHVKDVEATLSAIEGAGLTCHPAKCKFGQTTVAYLGFEVEGGKIGIQKAKVEVLDRVSTPKDRTTLRALLGFLNYYRKFMPNFSSRAAALNQLLREDKPWEWGPDQERAVQELMEAVKNGAVLELPRADLPFTLYTDWSSAGMGAVLAQMKGEAEKVVAFASRSCNAAEANYSSYEGEGLAVVWAVKHFRVYLQGRKFTLVTDHQPLLWLMQTPDLTGRNARWAMKLQEYDFEIRHRPGKTMQHVDGLSRNPPEVQPSACLMAMAKEADRGKAWGESKGGPADIWEDREALAWIQGATTEEGAESARVRARGEHYRWFKEQVHLRTGEGWKHVPPPAEREAIIKEVHTKLGHYGPLRTQQLVQTGWWWAGMRRQIKEWVEKCEACCRNRAVLEREKAELQPLPIVSLGYRWSLDIAGELPVSTKGRRYILLMVEHVSKWAEARPLVHKTAEAVAEAFEEMVITRLGACGEVLTDQGTEFEGAFDLLLKASGIRHRSTSRYHPQSDGLTERLVQTVKKGLRAYGEEHKRDWDRKLCWVMAGYRFSKQAALRDVSPYYLLFGKEPVMPVGAPRLLLDVVTTGSAEKWVAVADARAAYLRQLLPAALENLHVAQLRDIERYKQRQEANGKGAVAGVQEEEEVYLRRQRKHALDVGLSQQRWTVKEVRPSGVIVLEDGNGKRVADHVTNVARIRSEKGKGGLQGPMTRARTAAMSHGRGQGVSEKEAHKGKGKEKVG